MLTRSACKLAGMAMRMEIRITFILTVLQRVPRLRRQKSVSSIQVTNLDTANDVLGMHLWYASDNTTFKQYGWRYGDEEWDYQEDWKNLNGHAGVGCYSWGEGTVTYAMFVDLKNTVNFYWKDTNTNMTATDDHPINEWTNCKQNALVQTLRQTLTHNLSNSLHLHPQR